jgi:rSAM/selenodomain-associated transferase 1
MSRVNPESSRCVGIAILARAPTPGEAKTRLIPALGATGAAALQSWLLQRTVNTALAADVGPVTLWCTGDPQHPDFAHCHAFGSVTLRQQPAGDLGARMQAALRESMTPATLVIGTDCPALTATHLRNAAHALAGNDVVLLPAEDGGYVLIGAQAPRPELFADIEWSTERVIAQTRQRLATLGIRWHEPATLWDVDRPEDLPRLFSGWPDAEIAAKVSPVMCQGDLREPDGDRNKQQPVRRGVPDVGTP